MKKNSGMTLIEVMVALSIFSVAALAIMKSLTTQVRILPKIEVSLVASWAANNRMVEESFLSPHRVGKTKGDFKNDILGRQLYWQTEVSDVSDMLRSIKVSVSDDPDFKRIITGVEYYEGR